LRALVKDARRMVQVEERGYTASAEGGIAILQRGMKRTHANPAAGTKSFDGSTFASLIRSGGEAAASLETGRKAYSGQFIEGNMTALGRGACLSRDFF